MQTLVENIELNVAEATEYKKNIALFIENKTPYKRNGKQRFSIETELHVSNSNGGGRIYTINCLNSEMVLAILIALESKTEYFTRIVSYDNVCIKILEKEVTGAIAESRQLVLNFIRRLELEFKNHELEFSANVITSAIVAAKNNPAVIKISFKNEEQADKFIKMTFEIMKGAKDGKDGKLVKITIKFDEIKIILNDFKNFLTDKKSSKGLKVSSITTSEHLGYVHMSMDYSDFHFLPFNRKQDRKHTMELVDSMDTHGVLSFVNVVITNCIDGVLRKWVVDGQHRFWGMEYRNSPILYTITPVENKQDIVLLIANLNKNSKRWGTRDFLNAWHSLEIEDYTILKNALDETKLSITLLFEIFTNLERKAATIAFQKGKFAVKNKEESLKFIQYILEMRKYLPRSRDILSVLLQFFRNMGEKYSHSHMLDNLSRGKSKNLFNPGDSREEIMKKILGIYNYI